MERFATSLMWFAVAAVILVVPILDMRRVEKESYLQEQVDLLNQKLSTLSAAWLNCTEEHWRHRVYINKYDFIEVDCRPRNTYKKAPIKRINHL